MFPSCTFNLLFDNFVASTLERIITPITESSLPMLPMIQGSKAFDILVLIFHKVGVPSAVRVFKFDLAVQEVIPVTVHSDLTSITNSFVSVNVRTDGFTAVNVKPLLGGDITELYFRTDEVTYEMIKIGSRTFTEDTDYLVGRTMIVNTGDKTYALTEQVFNGVSTFNFGYKIYRNEIAPPAAPADFADIASPEIDYKTIALKNMLFFEKENMLKWLTFSQLEDKVVLKALSYDKDEALKYTVSKKEVVGSWQVIASNNWDCMIMADLENERTIKVISADWSPGAANIFLELTTNIDLAVGQMVTAKTAADGFKVRVGTQCRAFSINNAVAYLNDALDTYTVTNLGDSNLKIQQFDESMTYAALTNAQSVTHLYKVKATEDGFDMISYTDAAGTPVPMVLFAGNQILTSVRGPVHKLIIMSWEPMLSSASPGAGAYLIARN